MENQILLNSLDILKFKDTKTEIKQLNNKGIKVDKNNLFIAENVCLILPIHKTIDEINEIDRGGEIREGGFRSSF